MIIRYATEKDLRAVFDGSIPASMRAVIVEKDGRVVGIAGVARNEDHLQAFSKIDDELRGHKMTIGRMMVMAKKLRQHIPGPIFAERDMNEPTAQALLEWVGFQQLHEGWWCHGGYGG